MNFLGTNTVHNYVLQVLDELKNSDDPTMLIEAEGLDTLKLTKGYLLEATIKAHKDAPSILLDGVKGAAGTDYSVDWTTNGDGSAIIKMQKKTLRVVSLKAEDSPVVVSEYYSEDSAIGRMQSNEHIRGTYDDPKLIIKKVWATDRQPEFVYYSAKDTSTTFDLEYIPYPSLATLSVEPAAYSLVDGSITENIPTINPDIIGGDEPYVMISDKLEFAVLNLVAAMVLDSLSLHDKAAIYKTKYQEYLQTAR